MSGYFIIAAVLALAAVAAAIRALGNHATIHGITGERLTRAALGRGLDPESYRSIHDVTLPRRFGTIQLDHVVLSRCGIFVVETRHLFGEIVARADSRTWTQVLGENRKSTFPNPLRRNAARVQALETVTGLADSAFLPLVVVTGEGTFKTGMPEGVVAVDGLVDHIHQARVVRLSDRQIEKAVAAIEAARCAPDREKSQARVRGLRERLGGPAGRLVDWALKQRRQTLQGLRLAALALVVVVGWGGIGVLNDLTRERPQAPAGRTVSTVNAPASAQPPAPGGEAHDAAGAADEAGVADVHDTPDAPLTIVAPSPVLGPLPMPRGSGPETESEPGSGSEPRPGSSPTSAAASEWASASEWARASAPSARIIIEPDPPTSRPAKLGTVPPPAPGERILSATAQRRLFEETLDCEVTGVFRDCSCYLAEGAKVLVGYERCRTLAQYNGVRWISRPE